MLQQDAAIEERAFFWNTSSAAALASRRTLVVQTENLT
jgi:hypothetical protein